MSLSGKLNGSSTWAKPKIYWHDATAERCLCQEKYIKPTIAFRMSCIGDSSFSYNRCLHPFFNNTNYEQFKIPARLGNLWGLA